MDLSKYYGKDALGTLKIQGKGLKLIAEALAHHRLESITESVRPEFGSGTVVERMLVKE